MYYYMLSGNIRLFALLVVDRLLRRPVRTRSMPCPPPPNQASECQQQHDPTDRSRDHGLQSGFFVRTARLLECLDTEQRREAIVFKPTYRGCLIRVTFGTAAKKGISQFFIGG